MNTANVSNSDWNLLCVKKFANIDSLLTSSWYANFLSPSLIQNQKLSPFVSLIIAWTNVHDSSHSKLASNVLKMVSWLYTIDFNP